MVIAVCHSTVSVVQSSTAKSHLYTLLHASLLLHELHYILLISVKRIQSEYYLDAAVTIVASFCIHLHH